LPLYPPFRRAADDRRDEVKEENRRFSTLCTEKGGGCYKNKSLVKCRIEGVEIPRVQAVGGQAEGFTEMTHLNKAAETPFPPRFQAFAYRKKADRIFFESGLLFCVFNPL